MFVGHYGPAVWDTQRGKGVPLIKVWQGFLAVQAMDILCGILIIFGIEGAETLVDGVPLFNIPWSHSLVTSLILALCVGVLFRTLKPSIGVRGFWVVAGLVFSHWILDLIVHRPDLALYPGSDVMFGFGLWNWPYTAFILEMGLLGAALLFWQRVTTAKSKAYTLGLWAAFIFMGILQYIFILEPGLQVKAGTYTKSATPDGPIAGVLFLLTFTILAGIIALIERGRPSKYLDQAE